MTTSSAWLPIESAPKDGGAIIVYVRDEGFSTLAWWRLDNEDPADTGGWYLPAMDEWADEGDSSCLHEVTHWQPLPEPPPPPLEAT